MKKILVISVFICQIWGTSANTKKSFSIPILSNPDSLASYVKKEFKVDSVSFRKDTLSLLVHNRSIFYPFGKQVKLSGFTVPGSTYFIKKEIARTNCCDKTILYRLTHKKSFVKLINGEENNFYQIVSAKIYDKDIVLKNGLHTQLSKQQALELLFDKDVSNLVKHIKVIELESAAQGIWHYYNFNNDNLSSIILKTDYLFNQN